jgi:2-polyprenyl-3-methyl-5-hydroxy-6-metoxy-1,4-benzoquinol methylase
MSAIREIEAGQRFQFGANWERFLSILDDERIAEAETSIRESLGASSLDGLRFLDIGSGSGLFSLAARRLGATVHSFDFDPQSVACTLELKSRYFPGDGAWRVEEGSALDRCYMERLGEFDIVYSWGVLHHTGAMWLALENAIRCVAAEKGRLIIAIYNDQSWKSHVWWLVKFIYNGLPQLLRAPFVGAVTVMAHFLNIVKYTIKLEPMIAIRPLFTHKRERGMIKKYDRVDWIGGYPYEFVTFETLKGYLEARGFLLIRAKRTTTLGCSELSLQRTKCAE